MSLHQWVSRCLLLAIACVASGCAITPADTRPSYQQAGYELVYNEPSRWERTPYFGRMREGWSACRALFWNEGLLFLVVGGQVTIYKPGDGIFVSLDGFPSDDKGGADADPNRCLHHLFWKARPTGAQYFAILHPELKALFDDARSNPQALMQEIRHGAPGFTGNGMWREAKVSIASEVRIENVTGYGNYRSELLPLLSVYELFPDIARLRAEAGQEMARKQQRDAAFSEVRRQSAARAANAAAAAKAAFERVRFQAKRVGDTVCSQDNRIAHVEQVSGNRIRLLMQGHAISSDVGRSPSPITSPYYLFRSSEFGEERQINIQRTPGEIWDGAEHWGACGYR